MSYMSSKLPLNGPKLMDLTTFKHMDYLFSQSLRPVFNYYMLGTTHFH